MASKYWIKFYHEVLDDPKMGRLPDNLWRRFFELCLLAGETQMDGRLPPLHDIAWRLHVDEEALRIEFDQMARIGLVDFINRPLDEHWIVVNFDKRQEAQSAAERGKLFRKRQRKHSYYEDETENERNTNETFVEEEKEKEEDIEEDSTNFDALFSAFIQASGIPETMLANSSSVDTVVKWSKSGVTVADIIAAVAQLDEKGYTITRPASIDNALIIVMQERAKRPKQKEREKVEIILPDGTRTEALT